MTGRCLSWLGRAPPLSDDIVKEFDIELAESSQVGRRNRSPPVHVLVSTLSILGLDANLGRVAAVGREDEAAMGDRIS